ncbi:MAG: aspartyl/glutamyl-tRNA amidotransferase subunit C [Treponema sp.]|jgi:aspartyl-tRNA(Asn)/glutamyl-tRNA(Gln) amidotransferase subunit C|nr:aspartyl/glutamyl-tRNA amidotransferase subunit C [Treponema sp.]
MNIEDLKETAALAHLNLDEAELEGAFPAFEQMLGFFAAMQAADDDKAAFPAPAKDLAGSSRTVESGFFRLDSNNPKNFQGLASHNTSANGLNEETLVSALLNNAGERDGRFVVVPNVL